MSHSSSAHCLLVKERKEEEDIRDYENEEERWDETKEDLKTREDLKTSRGLKKRHVNVIDRAVYEHTKKHNRQEVNTVTDFFQSTHSLCCLFFLIDCDRETTRVIFCTVS